MEPGAIQFIVRQYDGFRLIEAVFPKTIDTAKLSLATTEYMALWDCEDPTVQINDVTRADPFDDVASNVLISILKRNTLRPSYLGSAYWIGDNILFESTIYEILVAAGRSPDCIFRDHGEALDYLSQIAASHGADAKSLDAAGPESDPPER